MGGKGVPAVKVKYELEVEVTDQDDAQWLHMSLQMGYVGELDNYRYTVTSDLPEETP